MNRVAQASEPAGSGGILPPAANAGRDARRTRSQDGCATRFMVPTHVRILEVSALHEPSRIEQRLVTCNLSLVTGDLQRSGPSVSQCPVTSYQLPVTSLMGVHEPPEFMDPTHVQSLKVFHFHDCYLLL